MSKNATRMALMLISMVALSNASGILPAYGLWPQQDFLFDMCAPNKGEQKGPWPVRVNDLCTSFGLNNPQKREDACEVVQLLKMMLASPAAAPLRCQPGAIIPPPEQDRDGVLLPLPLPDLRGSSGDNSGSLPEAFTPTQTTALLKAEGPSHLWLYKHVQRLQTWTPCEAIGKPQPWVQPPGWQLLRIFNVTNNLKAYKVDATSLPFAAVLRQASTPTSRAACRRALHEQRQEHEAYMTRPPSSSSSSSDGASVLQQHRLCGGDRLVVLLRGTSSAFEWTYNLNYTMGPDASYGLGQIHTGFHTVAEEVWGGGLQALLTQEVAQAGGVSNIIFSGHSLGGAVAALLAAKTQKYLADTLQSPAAATPSAVGDASASAHSPLLTAVTFGAPNIGNAAFAADFNTRVNARSIEYVADIVPQLPCAGHMPLCGPLAFSGHSADAAAEGDMDGSSEEELEEAEAGLDSTDSSSSSSSSGGSSGPSVSYAMLGARVQLEATNMPLQQDAWKQLSIYRQDDFCDNLATINALAEATHSCSYMCHLSAAAGQDNTWCMLWPAEGGHWAANATYCQHGRSSLYPLSPPFPPMT